MPDKLTETGRFDIGAIAGAFPESAATLLVDEYLYVFSGRGTFWMKDSSAEAEFRPGQLLFFERNTIHAMPKLFDHPVVFLSIDTPRRDPMDIIFVDPNEGTPQAFMARNRTTK